MRTFSPGDYRILETDVFGTSLPDALTTAKAGLRATRKAYETMRQLGVASILTAAILSLIPQLHPETIVFQLFGYSVEISIPLEITVSAYAVFLGLAAFVVAGMNRIDLISLRQEAEELEFLIDLDRDNIRSEEKRAARKLWQHNRQFRRYYDRQLKQNIVIFAVGIFVVLLVAAAAGYLIAYVVQRNDTKVILAVLSGIVCVLISYVAATYVQMHSSNSAKLTNFDAQLIETQRLLLSDLIASRVENSEIREQTFAKIAINLTASSGSNHSPSQNGLLENTERSEKGRKKGASETAKGSRDGRGIIQVPTAGKTGA
jgi:ABC-type branched-subunit amino acid transport system permease subunit